MRRAFSASIYLRYERNILLVHHKRLNQWLPVGGEVENGETPLDAARRELLEETGVQNANFPRIQVSWDIPNPPLGFLAYEEHEAGDKGLHMNFCFVAFSPTTGVVLCSEHKEFGWFALEEMDALDMPSNVRQLSHRAMSIELAVYGL